MKDFSDVCAAHRAEMSDIAMIQNKGWPKDIDWELFVHRAIHLRTQLERIIMDIDEDWQPHRGDSPPKPPRVKLSLVEDLDALAHRPRKESWVWKSLINDVISDGPLYTVGINGQWGNFERKLPG